MNLNAMSAAVARRIIMSATVALVVAGAFPGAAVAEAISDIGTWKLNVAKSSYSHDPMPQNSTLTIRRAWGTNTLRATTRGVDAEGKPTESTLIIMFNGKIYPANADNFSTKPMNRDSDEYARWRNGKIVQTGSTERSRDGKTLTLSTSGVNAEGQQVSNRLVYDRQ